MARGRDLMRFSCPDDATGAIVRAVVERKTLDSIYGVSAATIRTPKRRREYFQQPPTKRLIDPPGARANP